MISSAKPYSMPCRPLGSPAFRSVFPISDVRVAFLVTLDTKLFSALWRAFPLGMLHSRNSLGMAV